MAPPSTDMVLTPVSWDALTERDLLWLTRAVQLGYDGIKVEHLITMAARGQLVFLRFREQGIIAAQTVCHLSGLREFLVYALAGKGIFKEAHAIFEGLRYYAKLNDCSVIGGRAVYNRGMRVYEKILNMQPQAVYFVKEV